MFLTPGQALVWTAGRWAALISSNCKASELVMIHGISVKHAFSLSLPVGSLLRLCSGGDASVFAGPGAEPAGPT